MTREDNGILIFVPKRCMFDLIYVFIREIFNRGSRTGFTVLGRFLNFQCISRSIWQLWPIMTFSTNCDNYDNFLPIVTIFDQLRQFWSFSSMVTNCDNSYWLWQLWPSVTIVIQAERAKPARLEVWGVWILIFVRYRLPYGWANLAQTCRIGSGQSCDQHGIG